MSDYISEAELDSIARAGLASPAQVMALVKSARRLLAHGAEHAAALKRVEEERDEARRERDELRQRYEPRPNCVNCGDEREVWERGIAEGGYVFEVSKPCPVCCGQWGSL